MTATPPGRRPPEDEPAGRYLRRRLMRHWHWGRTQGFSRLIEEDELNPFTRIPTAVSKWRWRRSNGVAQGSAVPVFLVGLQRSGTNMLVRGLEASPEFEVHNENDPHAFHRFRLRSDHEVAAIVSASQHRYVLFKPLCDSHQIDRLLDELPVAAPGRAVWAFRDVDGRARSALAKFGDSNLQVLRQVAAGEAGDRWQAQRLSEPHLALIREFDYDTMSPASAAALFWYVRNSLFFEMRLDERDDVILSSYDAMVTDPEGNMRALCRFLGFPWRPQLTAHMAPRGGASRSALDVDVAIRERCEDLRGRLEATAAEQKRRLLIPREAEERTVG
ncbi:MAG: hypothetical protein ACR2J0_05145 [Mycobacteriales bacterium]